MEAVDPKMYVPLGSLIFTPSPDALGDLSNASWSTIDDTSELRAIMSSTKVPFPHLKLLLNQRWIRLATQLNEQSHLATLRVYVLPDDVARKLVSRDDSKTRSALRNLMGYLHGEERPWNGLSSPTTKSLLREPECSDQDSLIYIFNTIQSPKPNPEVLFDSYVSEAMETILDDPNKVSGLTTPLYPYQKRSIAVMMQRESQPKMALDPRLEVLNGPDGHFFYFDRVGSKIYKEQRCYEEARGGILAETMGLGKTLICLALILSTKKHVPEVPPEHSVHIGSQISTAGCRSLAMMAAAEIARNNLPWRLYFRELEKQGLHHDRSVQILEENFREYNLVKRLDSRTRRGPAQELKQKVNLSSTTLIVVPKNLMAQWEQEVDTHLVKGALSMVSIRTKDPLPPTTDLLASDVVLISRDRFEDEILPRLREDERFSGICCCDKSRRACSIHPYHSPLREIHWLRLIVDEGHSFVTSGRSSRTTQCLREMLVERRWIVSGTPTDGLLGVDLSLAVDDTIEGLNDSEPDVNSPGKLTGLPIGLEKLRNDKVFAQERKDVMALGTMATLFFRLQPWSNNELQGDSASWNDYVLPESSGRRKPVSLRNILESLVVRHTMEAVYEDLQLPPLHNRVVYLEPCFFDRLSMNLFAVLLAVNAVASERVDQDYMFHPKNRHQLDRLVGNLRHAGFSWTGFTILDVGVALKESRKYLEKKRGLHNEDDCKMLESAIQIGETALGSPAWKTFGDTREIGFFLEEFPENCRSNWSVSSSSSKTCVIGAARLVDIQASIESLLYSSDPFKDLDLSDGKPMANDVPRSTDSVISSSPTTPKGKRLSPLKTAVSKSSMETPQKLTASQFATHGSKRKNSFGSPIRSAQQKSNSLLPSALKSNVNREEERPSAYHDLSKPKITGTTSAKLSYLMDRVCELSGEEKILIFYEADYIAYYIAQALELLGIEHRIYANSTGLGADERARYLEAFNTTEAIRVMLMDLKQAAHGLHVASASRVFFVNPVWSPSVEAQAIKRAHRIGQKRPVYAETLILSGTLEEDLWKRRKSMTAHEHQKAQKSPLDDTLMTDIIKNPSFIPFRAEELASESAQMAPMKVGQQVFARRFAKHVPSQNGGQNGSSSAPLTNGDARAATKKRKIAFADEVDVPLTPTKQAKAKKVGFA